MPNRRVMRASYIVAMLIVIVASPAFAGSEHSGKTRKRLRRTCMAAGTDLVPIPTRTFSSRSGDSGIGGKADAALRRSPAPGATRISN